MYAEVGAIQRGTEDAGIGKRRPRRQQVGRILGCAIPLGIGHVETHFGMGVLEGQPSRRPGRREGQLGQFAGPPGCLDLVVAKLGRQLSLLGEAINGPAAGGQPVLFTRIALVGLVDELQLTTPARADLPVEELHQAIAG